MQDKKLSFGDAIVVEREKFEVGNKQYTVITKVIDNCKSNEKLYEIFSVYALERLKAN